MYRKGVAALIINDNQELLLVNLISFEEKYFAIHGGGSEKGESLEDTVYREIK
jgi:ADP-ribose pyrophosphatase YjhB (NUDIX family)